MSEKNKNEKKKSPKPMMNKSTPAFKEGQSALEAYEGSKEGSTEAVLIRNFAVYVLYRKVILISLFSFVLSVFSVFLVYTFATQKVSPQYVQLDSQGRLLKEKPLNVKDRSDGEVMSFAMDAVKQLNTYDYINIKDQINNASQFFTPSGWNTFVTQYTNSNTSVMVQDKRMIVSSEVTGEPKITKEGVISGVMLPTGKADIYTWAVSIPFKITYTAHSGKDNASPSNSANGNGYAGSLEQVGTLELLVMRTPANILPKGIGIASYNFDIKKNN